MASGGNGLAGRPQVPPEMIEARSFEIIAGLLPDLDHSRPEWPLIQRLVHTTGDPTIAQQIKVHPRAVDAGVRTLRAGGTIIADVKMVAAGISRSISAGLECEVLCAIDEPSVLALAKAEQVTRGTAAIRHLSSRLPGAIVAVGNAPTALFALLDYLQSGGAPPALIVGTPVGFVGAAEAKAELLAMGEAGVPYVTIEGTRGGSALAAAAVNALLRLAAEER